MSRGVEHRNDLYAFIFCIGDNTSHLSLSEGIGRRIVRNPLRIRSAVAVITICVIVFIACFQRSSNIIAAIAVNGQIIQIETEAAVAKCKLELIISGCRHFIYQRLYPRRREIFPAAVQMDNAIEAVVGARLRRRLDIVGRKARHGQQAQHHDQCKNHGKHFVQRRSILCLIHLLVIPFLCIEQALNN